MIWVFGQLDKHGSFEDYVIRIAELGRSSGFIIDVVTGPNCIGSVQKALQQAGASITCLAEADRDSAWGFAREVVRRRPAVVHCHFGSPSTLLAAIAHALGVRAFVFTDHGSRWTVESAGGVRRAVQRWRRRAQASFIDLWLPVSDFVRQMLAIEVGAPPARVRTLFNGIDLARVGRGTRDRAAVRAALGIPVAARVALYVGQLRTEKGVDDLLAIQDDLLAAMPQAVMVWAGGGPLAEAVVRSAGPRTLVLGVRDDVPDLLAAADIILAPSRWFEAFSLILAEAAAAGVPAVAARVGGIPEVVLDGETGLLVPPGDRAALLAAALRLLGDFGLRVRLGAAARRRAATAFSLDRMVATTLSDYRRLLQQAPCRDLQPRGGEGDRTVARPARLALPGAISAAAPRLSVIIPSRNALATLPAAVASVLALPLQEIEVIVVDDGSTDDTAAWLAATAAREPRLLPMRRDADHGAAAARNAGIGRARAPVLGFLDADDVLAPRTDRPEAALARSPSGHGAELRRLPDG